MTRPGFSVIFVLAGLVFITGLLVAVQLLLGSDEKRQKISRVRFEMARAESHARAIFSKSHAYSGCAKDPTNQLWTCAVSPQQIAALRRPIIGPPCGASFCGVEVTATSLAHATAPKLSFTLDYTGTDVRVKDSTFEFEIPKEALSGAKGVCGVDKNGDGVVDGYLYKGMDAAGDDICNGLPACPSFQFLAGLNPDGSAKCLSLVSGLSQDSSGRYFFQCSSNQYIKRLVFDPTSALPLRGTCEAQIDPCKVSDEGGQAICPPKGY